MPPLFLQLQFPVPDHPLYSKYTDAITEMGGKFITKGPDQITFCTANMAKVKEFRKVLAEDMLSAVVAGEQGWVQLVRVKKPEGYDEDTVKGKVVDRINDCSAPFRQ